MFVSGKKYNVWAARTALRDKTLYELIWIKQMKYSNFS